MCEDVIDAVTKQRNSHFNSGDMFTPMDRPIDFWNSSSFPDYQDDQMTFSRRRPYRWEECGFGVRFGSSRASPSDCSFTDLVAQGPAPSHPPTSLGTFDADNSVQSSWSPMDNFRDEQDDLDRSLRGLNDLDLKPIDTSQDVTGKPFSSSFVPSKSSYVPSQSSYAPSQSSYAPSQSSYVPSQSSYTPSQSSYTPSQSSYAPSQSSYVPSQSSLGSSNRFIPPQSSYIPPQSSQPLYSPPKPSQPPFASSKPPLALSQSSLTSQSSFTGPLDTLSYDGKDAWSHDGSSVSRSSRSSVPSLPHLPSISVSSNEVELQHPIFNPLTTKYQPTGQLTTGSSVCPLYSDLLTNKNGVCISIGHNNEMVELILAFYYDDLLRELRVNGISQPGFYLNSHGFFLVVPQGSPDIDMDRIIKKIADQHLNGVMKTQRIRLSLDDEAYVNYLLYVTENSHR